MSPTKPPHFWASLENEIKNLIVFDLRNHAESMYFKQTYSCILHPKNKNKRNKWCGDQKKKKPGEQGGNSSFINVPFYEYFYCEGY